MPYTFTIAAPVTPERLIDLVREQAPQMLLETAPVTRRRGVKAETGKLLYAREVADLFGVDQSTIGRWLKREEPRLTLIRTPGGARRFRETEVLALLKAGTSAGGQE